MKVIDISGFGHSGKGAFSDLLREFEAYYVPHANFEFNLLRIQGGILDLRNSLVENWSPIRSDAAIRRFLKLIKRIGPKADLRFPKSLFYSNGMNYDSFFNQKFSLISKKYIDKLIDYSYDGDWPFPMVDASPFKQFNQRFLSFFGIKKVFLNRVYVSSPRNFDIITKNYLDELLSEISNESFNNLILHNAFEPFNPVKSLRLFNNARSIIVQRDPRDIFCSAINPDHGYRPNYEVDYHWQLKRNFLRTDSIDEFIKRQKIYYDSVNYVNHERILRIRYEDLILNYNKTLKIVYDFVGENKENHVNKFKYFNPDLSKKNIGIWKNYEKVEEINLIYNELKEYCYK